MKRQLRSVKEALVKVRKMVSKFSSFDKNRQEWSHPLLIICDERLNNKTIVICDSVCGQIELWCLISGSLIMGSLSMPTGYLCLQSIYAYTLRVHAG